MSQIKILPQPAATQPRSQDRASIPELSVVIPTFNRGQRLLRAVRSVLAQTARDFEVLVVDDGCQDHTSGIVQETFGQDARVRLIRKENGGKATGNSHFGFTGLR